MMPDPFQSLIEAILANDSACARKLLEQNQALVMAEATKPCLEMRIPHWVYAGDSALHVAAAAHRAEMTKLLLKAGADCAAANNHRDSQPLHYASDGYLESPLWDPGRQVNTLKVLVDAGADLHARDKNGATALHRAVRTRCAAAVRFLIDAGADATLRNKPGSTPFHLAVQNTGRGGSGAARAKAAQREIIATFLEHGASPSLKDENGRSVLDWARSDWIRQMLAGRKS